MTPGFDPKSLFREEILKKRLQEEEGDEILSILPSYNRLGYYFIGILALIILSWLFIGALPVEIKGSGIFMHEGGVVVIDTVTDGTVDQILALPGNFVKEGDPLLILSNKKEKISLEFSKEQVQSLEAQYEKLKSQYAEEEKKLKEGLEKQIQSNLIKVEKLEKEIPILEKDYEKKQKLLKEQLVSTTTVLNAQNLLLQRKSALEATKSTIASLQANMKKSYHAEELKALEQRILQQKENRDLLLLNQKFNTVKSPFNAHILEILVRKGDPVKSGMSLMWIERSEYGPKDMIIYAFVPPDIGKRIALDQNVYVQPTNINAQEFGSLIAKVINISPTMLGSAEIEAFIHDKGLEQYLTSSSPNPYLLTIKPELDPTTESGFKWSSGKGIPFKITTGMVSTISGVAYYERPIVTLFPLWRIDSITSDSIKWLESWFEKKSVEKGKE